MKDTQLLKTFFLLCGWMVVWHIAWAQPVAWPESPGQTFVYQLSNKEALKLVKGNLKTKQKERLFRMPFASFSGTWEEQPVQGHYVYADIVRNQVNYSYHPVIPFQVFLFKEYGVLTLQVVDAEGNVRKDARVKLGSTAIPFDSASQTYTYDDWSEKEERLLTVQLDKFRAIFNLRKHLVPMRYDWGRDVEDDTPRFYSYLITDKNKYKPGETVRFKSYALSSTRRPLKEELTLFVQESGGYRFRKLKNVSPYHPGGFADEFLLVDSLKLQLDRSYSIQLRDRKGRIVADTRFKYEDYALTGKKLEVSLTSTLHYAPQLNKVEIVATDANGLMLQETEAEVTVRLDNVIQAYSPLLSLPDTLMFKRVRLDASVPTEVEIPSELFGGADVGYQVEVVVVPFDGERMEQRRAATFFHSRYHFDYEIRKDSIRFAYFDGGVERSKGALLLYDGGKVSKRVKLPYMEKFNQTLKEYILQLTEPDALDSELTTCFHTKNFPAGLELSGGFERDSLILRLNNPLQLDVAWYMYEGNHLLQKGYGKEIDFRQGEINPKTIYYAEIFYTLGGKEQGIRKTYMVRGDRLTVHADWPERIYPGQQWNTTLTVSNASGRPVSNVDMTAMAVNSQLNYQIPNLPDYQDVPQSREQRASYSMSATDYLYTQSLDYAFWNRLAGLDELMYYRFAYPAAGTLFVHTVDTPDGSTQFAPFLVRNGEAVGIYVIELDDVPVYFSWTEQPKAYSFPVVDPSRKHKVTLRLSDRAVIWEAVSFEAGKKTLFSMDMDHLPAEATVLPLPYKDKLGNRIFSPAEKDRYAKYICRMPVPANAEYTVLTGDQTFYPVYLSGSMNRNSSGFYSFSETRYPLQGVMAGPVTDDHLRYMGGVRYKHEGGFSYQFEDNVVYKYPTQVLPERLYYSSADCLHQLNDFHLTKVLFDSLIVEKRKAKAWHPSRIFLDLKDKRLNYHLPAEKDSSGVAHLLFEDCKLGKIIYPSVDSKGNRTFTDLSGGIYKAILVYNNGKYLVSDSLEVLSYRWLDVDMSQALLHERDALSEHWLQSVQSGKSVGTVTQTRWVTQVKRSYGNKVSGYVYASDGEPVIGCSVVIKGTTEGTITDLDGYFELYPAQSGMTLEFSYIGCVSKELAVTYGMDVAVVLEDAVQCLEEVVVIGYGMKRKNMTGMVAGVVAANSVPMVVPAEPLPDNEEKKAVEEAEKQLYRELQQLNGLRRNFSDVGFWEPRLYTDKEGKASFSVTFPDNITRWEAVVYAMNQKLKTGTYRQSIRSYKPLMAELSTPQFLVVGDKSRLAGTIRNYTDDRTVEGEVVFRVGQDTLMHKPVTLKGGHNDKLAVQPVTTDSLTTSYLFTRDDGYQDGEERTIPVLPLGTEMEKGSLGILSVGTPLHLEAAAGETMYVELTGQPLDIYLDAVGYLGRYKYLCNEQMASKLLGLLADKEYARYKGEKFGDDKKVNDLIRHLLANRNNHRLWAWWGRSEEGSVWMSAHVLRALKQAKDAGYAVDLDKMKLKADYVLMMPYRGAAIENTEMLHALSEWGVEQDYAAGVEMLQKLIREKEQTENLTLRAQKLLGQSEYRPVSYLKEKLLLWDILQKQGLANMTDSIRPYLQKDAVGGMYIDDGQKERSWYSGRLCNTLLAYGMIRQDSTLNAWKEAMQLYILGSKQYGWNTYYASMAVATILPDLLTELNTRERPATVRLSGKMDGVLTKFPYNTTLSSGEYLTLEKQDGVPVIYSAYTIEHVQKATTGDAFEVSTTFDTESLTAGTPATLTATVKVKQEAEYIMIEIPIPAGCEYASKPNSYRGIEVHREYFKEKTVIFCQKLPLGTYQFAIHLLPRYTGTYTVNPAKVELMYFPVVNANNDMCTLEISERNIE